ncbi:MAG: hypothetical protein SGCHY_000856 [Lobulomycetales sp.]
MLLQLGIVLGGSPNARLQNVWEVSSSKAPSSMSVVTPMSTDMDALKLGDFGLSDEFIYEDFTDAPEEFRTPQEAGNTNKPFNTSQEVADTDEPFSTSQEVDNTDEPFSASHDVADTDETLNTWQNVGNTDQPLSDDMNEPDDIPEEMRIENYTLLPIEGNAIYLIFLEYEWGFNGQLPLKAMVPDWASRHRSLPPHLRREVVARNVIGQEVTGHFQWMSVLNNWTRSDKLKRTLLTSIIIDMENFRLHRNFTVIEYSYFLQTEKLSCFNRRHRR